MKSRSRNIALVAIAFAALFAFSQKARDELASVFSGLSQWFDQTTIAKIYLAYQALKNVGLSGVQLKLALCQVMYETGAFSAKSDAANNDNNYTGIVWINNPAIQKNATQGGPADTAGYYWAHFKTVNDWAVDYDRIVNRGPNYPIDNATDPNTFAQLLSQNGYYTGSETNYAGGLLHYWNIFSAIGL